MRTRNPYPHLHVFRDRHGKPRVYLRKRGYKQIPLPWPVGSRDFVEAYQAALSDSRTIRQSRATPGTINGLVQIYYASDDWDRLAPQSKRTYRNILERLRVEHGDKPVRLIERAHIKAMVAAKAATPAAANKFRKLLSVLMEVAVEKGWRRDNPAAGVKGVRSKSQGHATWSEDNIAQFKAHHPVGSKARLAFDLLLYTGQRRGDVVTMGRQHVRDGNLTIRQSKTDAPVTIPIRDELQASLDVVPRDQLTFLVTGQGRPYSPAGFTNSFRKWSAAAGLPVGLSPHGLRKAMCRRIAEGGGTAHQIMAVSGHKSLSEVTRYTQAADRVQLGAEAINLIERRTRNGKPSA